MHTNSKFNYHEDPIITFTNLMDENIIVSGYDSVCRSLHRKLHKWWMGSSLIEPLCDQTSDQLTTDMKFIIQYTYVYVPLLYISKEIKIKSLELNQFLHFLIQGGSCSIFLEHGMCLCHMNLKYRYHQNIPTVKKLDL